MDNTTDHIRKKYRYAADYGLILGGYIAVFFLLDYLFPNSTLFGLLNSAGFFATPVVVYQLAKRYRDKAMGGYIRFYQVWSFGVWLFLFAALIMSVFYYVRFRFLQPDFVATSFNQAIQLMEQMKYSQEQIDKLIAFGVPTVPEIVLGYLWSYILGGAILSLIISPFVARKRPEPLPGDDHYQPYRNDSDAPND
jgi:hypothetical protein